MNRRRALVAGLLGLGTLAAGGGAWLAGPSVPIARLPDLAAARRWIVRIAADPQARTLAGWPLAQVLEHAAQSIEYSIDGYPRAKPAWFRASAGPLAFRAFSRAGAMRHDLAEPIPGAPALQATTVEPAAARLLHALDRFERHRGSFAPHFAFGALDRDEYERAHLMHLADHAVRVAAPTI